MRLPQFTMAGILWAVFWLSVCFAAWRVDPSWFAAGPGLPIGEWLFNSLRFFPVPTAIGALFGHTLRGFIIGIALYVCLLAFAFFAMASGLAGGP
jgi:hypothetical protein